MYVYEFKLILNIYVHNRGTLLRGERCITSCCWEWGVVCHFSCSKPLHLQLYPLVRSINLYEFINTYMYICIYICYVYLCVGMCVYIYMCVCLCACEYVCICTSVYVCVSVCVCMCVCVCMSVSVSYLCLCLMYMGVHVLACV